MSQRQSLKRRRSVERSSSMSFSNRNSSRAPSAAPHGAISFSPQPPPSRRTILARSHPNPGPRSVDDTLTNVGDEEEADSLDEIVMAIDLRGRGRLGCTYYVAREEKLYFLEDIQLGGIELVDSLRLYIEPTVVLTSITADDALLDHLDPNMRQRRASTEDGQFHLPYTLELRPSGEFAYEASKNKLASLTLPQEPNSRINFVVPGDMTIPNDPIPSRSHDNRQAQLLKLAGWIDLESRLTVGCAGALLSYLHRRRAATYLPGDDAAMFFFRVSSLGMFSLKDTMFINQDTLMSLQIIQSESHPHAHNQGPTKATSGSKEGLSVYGLFHFFARTFQGRHLLRQYFLRPSQNLEIIDERHHAITVLLVPENSDNLDALIRNLKPIKNLRTILINLRKGICSGDGRGRGLGRTTWANIRQFVFHALKIRDTFQEFVSAEDLMIRSKVFAKFEPYHFAQVGRKISETIDFDESLLQHKIVVQAGVDRRLDEMKQTHGGIENLLAEVAEVISEKIPAQLEIAVNAVFFPQIGFLIAIPLDSDSGHSLWSGTSHDPWERMFATENAVYYKSSEMVEMDEHFGDVYSEICDREIEIIHSLAQHILEYEELLNDASDICGELDALVALAQGARHYKLVRPSMTTANVLDIKSGRHILQELTVPAFVANNTYVAGGDGEEALTAQDSLFAVSETETGQSSSANGPSTIILTGPNHSGKSVYLKQAALIVYMAHIGSFVPATSAVIGLTDKILTRIATRESVSRTQSSFMIDLQQISIALSLATRRSLLIIDEFGKGTDSTDGAALACSVFEYLLGLGKSNPKVLGATHFHEIFESGFLKPRPELQFGHMEVRVDPRAREVEDQITYLYTFRNGRSNSSYGALCAAINGVASEIVDRAEQLTLLAARGEDLVSICAVMPEREMTELQDAERIARGFLAADLDEVDPMEMLQEILTAQSLAETHRLTATEDVQTSVAPRRATTTDTTYFSQ